MVATTFRTHRIQIIRGTATMTARVGRFIRSQTLIRVPHICCSMNGKVWITHHICQMSATAPCQMAIFWMLTMPTVICEKTVLFRSEPKPENHTHAPFISRLHNSPFNYYQFRRSILLDSFGFCSPRKRNIDFCYYFVKFLFCLLLIAIDYLIDGCAWMCIYVLEEKIITSIMIV